MPVFCQRGFACGETARAVIGPAFWVCRAKSGAAFRCAKPPCAVVRFAAMTSSPRTDVLACPAFALLSHSPTALLNIPALVAVRLHSLRETTLGRCPRRGPASLKCGSAYSRGGFALRECGPALAPRPLSPFGSILLRKTALSLPRRGNGNPIFALPRIFPRVCWALFHGWPRASHPWRKRQRLHRLLLYLQRLKRYRLQRGQLLRPPYGPDEMPGPLPPGPAAGNVYFPAASVFFCFFFFIFPPFLTMGSLLRQRPLRRENRQQLSSRRQNRQRHRGGTK